MGINNTFGEETDIHEKKNTVKFDLVQKKTNS